MGVDFFWVRFLHPSIVVVVGFPHLIISFSIRIGITIFRLLLKAGSQFFLESH